MPATMAKRKPKRVSSPPEEKAVLYIEVPPWIKEAMEEIAAENDRKLTGEVIQALKAHLERHGRGPAKGTP
jgi:hypothetical protein